MFYIDFIIEVICSFIVAYSFGVLFNIKGSHLKLAGTGGAIGWFVYKSLFVIGIYEWLALFFASVAFSFYSEISARIFYLPSTLIKVCALIVLVPGYGIYNSMVEVLTKNYTIAMDYATTTLSNACALALGVVLVSSIYNRKRFMQNKK